MSKLSIGGQAVLEGVMMKNTDKYAIAVRKPDNEIEVKVTEYEQIGDKIKFFRLPIIRGVVNFIESMVIGVKTLTYSADLLEECEEEMEADIEDACKKEGAKKEKDKEKDSQKSDSIMMFFTVALSIAIAIGLFMLLPAFITGLIKNSVKNHFLLGLIEGVIRLVIFILYVYLISLMKDIKRTYMYHGAEHKTINCLESLQDLTVENVKKHSRFHKRCGTSFLFIVMFVSILVFMCITAETMIMRLLLRLLLVPVIAGISYEFIRFAGKSDSALANILSKPGLWVQRMTTVEPDDGMIEVAIKSVEGVLDWKKYIEEQKDNG